MNYKDSFEFKGNKYDYCDIKKLGIAKISVLPYSIRVLLECAIRNFDDYQFTKLHVDSILNWPTIHTKNVEIPFKPSRVLLQDFTGVPAIVDFAAMRDSIVELGGDAKLINPVCPVDLVIDHSVQVDVAKSSDALQRNQDIEFDRNHERFSFLKWGANNLSNMLIVPPGSGIVHQVNLECLARVVFGVEGGSGLLYPDSVVGTDSHTTMINGLGVLGWGVGGIEAEAVMLDQPVNLVLPPVTGFEFKGSLGPGVTSTDLVLTVTSKLRGLGVVGHFVEFYGDGVAHLSIADRATVANMCPEYGATCGFFPVDERSMEYLAQTGRSAASIEVIRQYLVNNRMFSGAVQNEPIPQYSRSVSLDLATIKPCLSGPKRPHDYVAVSALKKEFQTGLSAPLGFKSFNIPAVEIEKAVPFTMPLSGDSETQQHTGQLHHGDVVIASITSCTNTSNPSVMLAAGLLAKKACDKGLRVAPHIKTSLSPGSGVVTKYLEKSDLKPFLDQLGFNVVGYGCMTCIGNSGPLQHESITRAVEDNNLVVASVLSGNRNFEGRVHPLTRANYLASPPLVIAYALAGTVCIDFDSEPLGHDRNTGQPVFLRDLWPANDEITRVESSCILPEMFKEVYNSIKEGGSTRWQELPVETGDCYRWQPDSTYIQRPGFFEGLTRELPELKSIVGARALLNLGDSITTDHISPAGSIARNSPAARYLAKKGVRASEFNSYGSRRGNDAIMTRGTFANIRLVNKMVPDGRPGPRTVHWPSRKECDIFDCAERYREDGVPVIVLAGKEYGSGSSRDWAAKGPYLLGVRAVIAESFERIHRSNLIGMGIMPLQFQPAGVNADSLGLDGSEQFSIEISDAQLKPGKLFTVKYVAETTGEHRSFQVLSRFDTEAELAYFRNGGILQYMIRKLLNQAK